MSQLDFMLGSSRPRVATGFSPQRPSGQPVSFGRPGPAPKTPLERIDVNEGFASVFDLDKGSASLFATLGQLPARAMETPVSLVDTVSQRAFGFSPTQAIGAIPGVGQTFGVLGEAVKRAGNFVPALINQHDATVWKAVWDLPDNTPITDALVEQRNGIDGIEGFLRSFDEDTGGGPFGIGSRRKTVGEFRDELAKRGFFFDPDTGEPLDPGAVGSGLRSGQQNTTDFGYAAINDNAMVDLAGRLALDPTNALFLVPGANLAKVGQVAARLFPASRAVRAGIVAEKAARPVVAAEAIAKGSAAGATLRGMARFLRGYRTFAVGTAVGNFGLNRLSGAVNDVTGDSIGFLREIEEFTGAVENAQPMSNNAAFMLLTAATFPYGSTVLRPIRSATRGVSGRVFGRGDLDAIAREYGGTSKAQEAFGGPDGLRDLADFIDVQIAADTVGLPPGQASGLRSIQSLAVRRRSEAQAYGRIVDDMRRKGEITSEMRLAKFKEWFDDQAGVLVRDEFGRVIERRGTNPWDPARAARRWQSFRDGPRQQIKPLLDETGEAVWGLRDDVVFTHQLDDIDMIAARAAKANDKIVPIETILDIINDHPNVNALDHTGWWAKYLKPGAKPPTLRALRDKLTRQRKQAVGVDEYFSEFAVREASAPKDITVPRGPANRPQRITELRAALDETLDGDTIRPGREADAQGIQRELETLLAEENGVHWATQGIRDRKSGVDPVTHREAVDAAAADLAVPDGRTFYRGTKPGETKRIQTGDEFWDAQLFAADNVRDAQLYGPSVERIVAKPDAKIIREGTDEYNRIIGAFKGGRIFEYYPAAARKAKELGYDAVHFRKQGDIGTVILNEKAFTRNAQEAVPRSMHPLLWKHQPDEVRQRIHAIDRELALVNPSYRVKALGAKTILRDVPETLTAPIRYRNALGEALFQTGPFSTVGKFIHALTRPITRDELRTGTRQQLMDDLLPLGWRPGQVDALIKKLDAELDSWTFGENVKIRMFRDPGSLLPSFVNRAAESVLVEGARNAGQASKVLAATRAQGGAYRMLSRASSRYFRSIDGKARAGDRTAAAMRDVYNGWNRTSAATGQRVLAKTVYPMVRFMFDPRWLMLNYVEGGILGATKYGARRAYTAEAQASGAATFFNRRMDPETAAGMSADIGQTLQNTNLQLIALKSFDLDSIRKIEAELRDLEVRGERVAAIRKQRELGEATEAQMTRVLDELGESDKVLAAARDSMRREAEDAIRAAQRRRDAGEIDDAAFLAETEVASRQLDMSNRSLAEHLNDKFYRFERDGVDKTLTDEIKALGWGDDEVTTLAPLIERVHEINRQSWQDINGVLHGNPQRSTIERVLNSYWFLWPLSYQLKATKWLADIMLNGSFGHNNGALLAGRYALWHEQHTERMLNNPAYAAMYEAQPTLWFAAQMVLPMSPESIGVSTSRLTRLIGAQGQDWLNEWFNTEVGVFTSDALLGDPADSLRYITELGPIYTIELLRRMQSEVVEEGFPGG